VAKVGRQGAFLRPAQLAQREFALD